MGCRGCGSSSTGSAGPQGPQGAGCVSTDSGNIATIGSDGCFYVPPGSGPTGAQGPQGDTGAQGPQGDAGVQGPQGTDGAQGPQGDAGPQGLTGAQGDTGAQGSQGAQGSTGTGGLQGPQGADGVQGATGTQGPQGTQGTQGATGAQGPQGDAITGPQGPQGAAGAGAGACISTDANNTATLGSDGCIYVPPGSGPTGAQGPQGAQGAQGDIGATGAQGAQGSTGVQGATGTQGPQGTQGTTGAQGSQGVQGATGPQGPQGSQGLTGVQGPQGLQGAQGADGTTVVTGDGVTGAGTPANPYVIDQCLPQDPATWPIVACTVDSGAGVWCDSTGHLRTRPPVAESHLESDNTNNTARNLPGSEANSTVLQNTTTLTNPSACYSATVQHIYAGQIRADLVAGDAIQVSLGHNPDVNANNFASTAGQQNNWSVTGTFSDFHTIPPGGSITITTYLNAFSGNGMNTSTIRFRQINETFLILAM